MTQEEVIKLAKEAGFGNYAYEAAGIFSRFAAMVASTEREKCTNTQEFVTLPREVVKLALESMDESYADTRQGRALADVLRAALEQPQDHVEQHLGMVPAGWKLVPVEPNCSMVLAGERSLEQHDFLRLDSAYRAMLAAAPQPPVVEQPQIDWHDMYLKERRRAEMWIAKYEQDIGKLEVAVPVAARPPSVAARTCANCLHNKPPFGNCDGCSQQNDDADDEGNWEPIPEPQGEQEPVAWIRTEWSSRTLNFDGPPAVPSVRDELTKPVWTPLYTHPQPKRELTDNEARRIYNEATYHASIAVFMTRMDAEHQDADDKGVSGWLQEAEDRVKHRTIDAAHEIGQAAAPQQVEQEPYAWHYKNNGGASVWHMGPSNRLDADIEAAKSYPKVHQVTPLYLHPQPKREPLSKDRIREILMCNGFTIKDGEPDLKPYVYNAVQAILDAALQQPVVDHPQANQPAMTPIAQRKLDSLLTEGYTISGYSIYHEQKHQHGFVTGAGLVGWWKPEGVEYPQPQGEPSTVAFCHVGDVVVCDNDSLLRQLGVKRSDKLYLHQQDLNCKSKQALLATLWGYTKEQPKRPPLTDEEIDKIAESMPGGLEGFLNGWGWRQFARAVLENDHNIK